MGAGGNPGNFWQSEPWHLTTFKTGSLVRPSLITWQNFALLLKTDNWATLKILSLKPLSYQGCFKSKAQLRSYVRHFVNTLYCSLFTARAHRPTEISDSRQNIMLFSGGAVHKFFPSRILRWMRLFGFTFWIILCIFLRIPQVNWINLFPPYKHTIWPPTSTQSSDGRQWSRKIFIDSGIEIRCRNTE